MTRAGVPAVGGSRVMSWARPERDYNFQPGRYGVAAIPDDTTAAGFVESHHYSGADGVAVLRYGLYDLGDVGRLVGAAVLSNPPNVLVLTNVFPHLEPSAESLELGPVRARGPGSLPG